MRTKYPKVSVGVLCSLFGISRQAYYESRKASEQQYAEQVIVLALVHELRAEMPLLGTRKLYHLLRDKFHEHNIKMGRDQLFDLLRFHGLLVRRRRPRSVSTTNSHHWLKKYPNLIIGLMIDGPNQLWITDITYIRTMQGFCYLSLVTDAYSRKICGYCLYETLEAKGCEEALIMAIKSRSMSWPDFQTIHHSDRGVQYCSAHYVELLNDADIAISMTQTSSPYENAIAERVNGTVKNEFNPNIIYQNFKHAQKNINKIIYVYNHKRPHLSIDYLTPEQAHSMQGKIKKAWKTYPKKYQNKKALSEQGE